jgi:predicted alpha/beta hydrolase family esterase
MLLHGWGGSDYPHWQSYIAAELAKDYGCVNFVRFPHVDMPTLDSWIACAVEEIASFAPDVVICHSLANTLWFHLCNEKKIKKTISNLILVAPPSLTCSIKELQTFFPVSIPENLYAQQTLLIVSDNDPYMDIQEAKILQEKLHVEMHILPNAGHINSESGYGAWSWLLEIIKKMDTHGR